MLQYYPLAAGNKWEYKQTDGSSYTNTVLSVQGNMIAMKNSRQALPNFLKIKGAAVYNGMMLKDNFQLWLKDEVRPGEKWKVAYRENGFRTEIRFTVIDTGLEKGVEGHDYKDVILVEAQSSIRMNDSLTATEFLTQYYYAKGIGLILSISSLGELHALVGYNLS
jgi:hypothetical protein